MVKEKVSDEQLKAIHAVCPGLHVTAPDPKVAGPNGKNHPVWGPIRDMKRGWSSDPAVRFRAAAGGTLTQFGIHLLETGKVDAIVHVRTSKGNPMLSDAHVSTTREEVIEGSQSRYGPAAPLVNVHKLLDEGKRFAVIAKPCDIAAIRNLQKSDPRAKEQIPYCLTLFCGGYASALTPPKIARYHGVEPENVAVFRFRGNGWPGPLRVESKQGEIFDLGYEDSFDKEDLPWTYDVQFRCKICADAIGEQADISSPDAWVLKDGVPIYDEAPGVNLLIARTETGEKLLNEVIASGEMETAPFDMQEMDAMHASHLPRKLQFPGRHLGVWLAGQPITSFRGFRWWKALLRGGLLENFKSMYGTWKRVRRGDNLEPLD
ncbi:Coenzyme F420 hydrogenase/dehydrogenase, beta subunit C-terminal domain [Rhodobacteraceae bacterium B1Z28]|uniref:Coenzyme F420 hydrogenase/dehydrogenase, beta subunit C-terminal domain n=1 Tax=Ruegeria haliotis TaxID=2747601 RepID=A0ABX2PS66_9RHOB|nr:Coenzyme F420 hydrogenase/dehydrogenase, beta subunit C-terminal domain [Ruegeria haliotis]NVO56981.1 Coenzyme F420 hydrogenase/dehydrogenase, beta subunit C-terminal domain [Ruegeria haliotis]